jgi:hypothetical protein
VELEAQLVALDDLHDKAVERGSFTAAIKAKAAAGEVRLRLRRIEAEEQLTRAKSPLRRIQILRGLAVQDGSWIAAAKLAEEEERLRLEEEQAEAAEAQREADGQTDAEIAAALVQAIRRLPAALRESIVAELQRPVLTVAAPPVDEDEDEDG